MQLSPYRDSDLKHPRPIRDFLIIGALYRIETQLSRNWVSTVAPLCRCLLDKLRQNNIHIIFKDTMYDADTKKYIILGHIMYDMNNTLHSVVQCGL